MKVKIINKSNFPLPRYATDLSAGMDLRANFKGPMLIMPFERLFVPTGIYIELPEGYEAQLRPRSGIATKHGITIVNSPATIDADYRGEIKVCLINLSDVNFTIEPGDRICQMVVAKHEKIEWEKTTELSETKRGEGGFNSTGLK